MFVKSFIKIFRVALKNWQCSKKRRVVSASLLQERDGFKVSSVGLKRLETISFWQNISIGIFKFSLFLSIKSY